MVAQFLMFLDGCAEAVEPWPLLLLVLFVLIYGGARLAHWAKVARQAREHEKFLKRMGI